MFTHRLDEDRWLRLPDESDAEELYELTALNREMLAEWLPWAAAATLQATLEFIRSRRREFVGNGAFSAVIVERDRIVGSIGFPDVNHDQRRCEIGYWLAHSAQGRGTVTLAARALIDYAFAAWKMRRVTIQAGVGNARSRAVAERLGFTLEGVLRDAERFPDGHYVDLALYGLLAPEWSTTRSGARRDLPTSTTRSGARRDLPTPD
jgi:ribosomal-protein-serine acetyltransferase